MNRAFVALAVVLFASRAVAQSPSMPQRVLLTVSRCAEQTLHTTALTASLRIELGGAEVITVIDAATPSGLTIALDCSTAERELFVRIDRLQPLAHYEGLLAIADVPEDTRARTVALAVAENINRLELPPAPKPEAIVPAPAPIALTPPSIAPMRYRNPRTLSITKKLAIGLGVGTVLFAAIGGPILSTGLHTVPQSNGYVAAGAAMIGLSVASGGGTAASIVVWALENRFPAAAPATAATTLELRF